FRSPDTSIQWLSPRSRARAPSPVSGDPAKNRTSGEPGSPWVVEVEDPSDEFATRVEAGDRLAVGVDHLCVGGDPQASKSESNSAGHRICLVRWRIKRVGPITLGQTKAFGASTVLDIRIEGYVGLNRCVELGDSSQKASGVHAIHLRG